MVAENAINNAQPNSQQYHEAFLIHAKLQQEIGKRFIAELHGRSWKPEPQKPTMQNNSISFYMQNSFFNSSPQEIDPSKELGMQYNIKVKLASYSK
jgi:hypothetical protein